MAGSVPQPFRTIAVFNRVKLSCIERDFAFAFMLILPFLDLISNHDLFNLILILIYLYILNCAPASVT